MPPTARRGLVNEMQDLINLAFESQKTKFDIPAIYQDDSRTKHRTQMITPKANWEAGARLSDLVTDYVLVDPNGTPDRIVFDILARNIGRWWWRKRRRRSNRRLKSSGGKMRMKARMRNDWQ